MDRIKASRETLERLYGEVSPAESELAEIKRRLIYGEIYADKRIDDRLRELIIIAVAAVNLTPEEAFRHTRAGIKTGLTPEEITEAVYQTAPYIGLGKTEIALRAVNEALIAEGYTLPVLSMCSVTESGRLPEGIAAQKSAFGEVIDNMRNNAKDDEKAIQDYLSAYCFGDFYTRGGLDMKQRELLTFSIITAQGGCENQVRGHINGNIAVGNGRDTLLAALTVCLPYIGFPRTLNSLACINEILP